jgi:hypothetical protein
MNIPTIRLELTGMKQTMQAALSHCAAQLDSDVKAAVEAYCTEGNMGRVVSEAATNCLNSAIKEEVEKFFRYGHGREAVAAAIKEAMADSDVMQRYSQGALK